MSPNRLEIFCQNNGINSIEAMNALQGAGIVSDNAVILADVAEEDHDVAINFLYDGVP